MISSSKSCSGFYSEFIRKSLEKLWKRILDRWKKNHQCMSSVVWLGESILRLLGWNEAGQIGFIAFFGKTENKNEKIVVWIGFDVGK